METKFPYHFFGWGLMSSIKTFRVSHETVLPTLYKVLFLFFERVNASGEVMIVYKL